MTTTPDDPNAGRNPADEESPPLEKLLETVPTEQLLYGVLLPGEGGEEWSYVDDPEAAARVTAEVAERNDEPPEPAGEIVMTMDGGEEWSLNDEQGRVEPGKNGPGLAPDGGKEPDQSPPAENPPPAE